MGNNQSEQSGANNDSNNRDPEGRDATKDRDTKGQIVIPYTQGIRGKHKKHMQEVWDPDPYQGKQNHQEYTSQTQGYRPFGQRVVPSTGTNVGSSHVLMNT